jgi:transcriptional regulator with XRE-family HTH domain
MRLADYLTSRKESQSAFARRTGVPQATINNICNGAGTRSDTALKIIHATGGLVTLEDLVGNDRPSGAAA